MYPFLCDRVPSDIAEEYRWKIKHNFKQYIYLGLKSGRWEQQRILTEILKMEGYVAHRIIKYSNLWSHIYIKFENDDLALNAVDYFRCLDCNLNAELVDNLLCSWYIYENLIGFVGQGTVALIDTVGTAPHCMNPMIEPVLAAILYDFGEAYVFEVREATAQVIFNSMAEALAACIAHGKWETNDQLYSQFYFRIRIIGDNKEAVLIGKCLSHEQTDPVVQEAFKLDYFVDSEDSRYETVENYSDANVLNNVEPYCSVVTSLNNKTTQQGRKIRGRSELSTYPSIFEGNSSHCHIPSYQSSLYPTSRPMRTVVYNDYGVPLGTIMVNDYGTVLPAGNTNYVPSILQEVRFRNTNIPSNVPFCNEDYVENSRHSSASLLCNQRSFTESSIPNTGQRIYSQQNASSSKELSSENNLQTKNWSLNRATISSHLNTETSKNVRLKHPSKDASPTSAKSKDYEVSNRTKYSCMEFKSSKFRSSFSQSKNYRNK